MKCPTCQQGDLISCETTDTFRIGEESFLRVLEGEQCTKCKDIYFSLAEGMAAEAKLSLHLLDFPITPDRAKFIRKSAGLTKGDLAAMSGIPAEHITSWENGEIPVSPRLVELRSLLEDRAQNNFPPRT